MDLKLNNNNANIGDESYGSIFFSQICPNNLGSDLMAWMAILDKWIYCTANFGDHETMEFIDKNIIVCKSNVLLVLIINKRWDIA